MFVVTVNVKRRQFGREQKEELIRAYLLKDPAIGDKTLADLIGGISKNKVAEVRAEMEAACLIDKVMQRRGADGKMYPAKYPRIVVNSPKEMERALEAIKSLPANGKTLDATTAARRARVGRRKPAMDDTETPLWLCQWIWNRITAASVPAATILDPCAGNGNLTRPFSQSKVIAYEISEGRDFFDAIPTSCDLVLCNPPWADADRWLPQVVQIVGRSTPIVFICTMENLHYDTNRMWKYLHSPSAPKLNSVTVLPAHTFPGINSQGAIFWFNLPQVCNVALAPSDKSGLAASGDI